MKPIQLNHLRIVFTLLIFVMLTGLLGPIGRAGRSESVGAAAPARAAQDGKAQPADFDIDTNPQPINIPDSGAASPYPSQIQFSGLGGDINIITVRLNGFTHTNPDDVKVMLVGPAGQKFILMGNAGGSTDANNVFITFADAAETALPDGGPLVTGSFQPTNYAGSDNFPAPAPPPPYFDPALGDTFRLVFNGDPNGTYSLYVVNNGSGNSGSIGGGWTLSVGTAEVTNLNDSGPGSLRQAILDAAPGATITVLSSLTGTITLTSGELVIDKSLTIRGPGADKLCISGNNASRVFNIVGQPGVNVFISDLKIAIGNAVEGGGIRNTANLGVNGVTFLNNMAVVGGAIHNTGEGRVEAVLCTFDGNGNENITFGGAIHTESTHPIASLIDRCIFENNDAGFGGAIGIDDAALTVRHTTINDNVATGGGGGIYNIGGMLSVINTTFSANSATNGAGIHNDGGNVTIDSATITLGTATGGGGGILNSSGGAVTLRNTIVDGNNAPSGPDISGAVNSQGFNLVSNSSGGSGFIGSDQLNVSARLGPLQYNGGPVKDMLTHAPGPGSPAINSGNTAEFEDQRFYPRLFLSGVFRGAVEADPREDSLFENFTLSFRNEFTLRASVTLREDSPAAFHLNDQCVTFGLGNVTVNDVTDINGVATAILPLSGTPTIDSQTISAEFDGSAFNNPFITTSTIKLISPAGSRSTTGRASPDGSDCPFLIFSPDESFAANGGTGTINVRSFPQDCNWTAVSNDPWIQITSGASGTGDGAVTYTVAPHTDPNARRAGSITVAGLTYNVLQGAAFLDVPQSNIFYTFIGKLSARGVTVGIGGGNYGPGQPVTREQMAAFIIRALGMPNPPPPAMQRFDDVPPSNPFYAFIEQMAVRQITLGCSASPPLYCPSSPVLREQMAAFLIRALGEPNPPVPFEQRFNDVPPPNPFNAFIERMAIRRITLGCSASPPLYCPSASVTREQMAAFLVRAFGL